jgi:hypothetical protein
MYICNFDTRTIEQIKNNKPIELIFSEGFNDNIYDLPECIEKIIFGLGTKKNNCNYKFEHLVKKEKLFEDYDSISKFNNNSINNLPCTIKWIIFPCESTFNTEIKSLPNCLELLSLGKNYMKKLNNLPESLKYFFYFMQDFYPNIKSLPDTIEYIGIISNNVKSIEKIPSKTKLFKICSLSSIKYISCDIGNVSNLIDKLPDCMEKLILTCNFYSEIKFLPSNLTKLKITQLNKLDLLSKLPNHLTELDIRFENTTIPNNFDELNSNLPCCLKKLSLDYSKVQIKHKQSFINLGCLPDSLEYLSIKDNLEKSILDNLPTSLKFLKIESILLDYQKDDIEIFSNLPRGLEKLLIVIYPYNINNFEPILIIKNLPESLIELVIFSKLKYTLDKEYSQLTIHHFENRIVDEYDNYDKKYIKFDELFF